MEPSDKIPLDQYVSVAISTAEACGRIIRDIWESGVLEKKDKGVDDPVTIADLRVQKTIETNFKHFFPNLKTMGEESAASLEGIESQVTPDKINQTLISLDMLNANMAKRADFNQQMREQVYGDEIWAKFDEIDTSNAVVWIDPLDGTKDFTNGNLSAVTVLIGLAVQGVPKVGIVHNPFRTNDNDGVGITFFATQEHGAYNVEYNTKMEVAELEKRTANYMEPFDIKKACESEYKVKVAASLTHMNKSMSDFLDTINPIEVVRLGGAGNKVNRIALNEVDSYIQPRAGLGYWDICAPESIVRAMGGVCTNFEGKRFDYSPLKVAQEGKKIHTLDKFVIAKTNFLYKLLAARMKLRIVVPKERTYIMIKPDGVQRGLIGTIISRFETKGFKLVAMKMCQPGKAMFEKHYSDLASKKFFPGLVDYAASGPVCCMVWEGDNAVLTGRKMLGATKPFDSAPGTIRGDFCIDVGRNIIHGSDAVESANHEIALWFKDSELVDWDNHSQKWVYE